MDVRREFAAVRDLDDPERETWGVSGAAPKLDVAEMLTTREDDDGGPCAGSAQGRRLRPDWSSMWPGRRLHHESESWRRVWTSGRSAADGEGRLSRPSQSFGTSRRVRR